MLSAAGAVDHDQLVKLASSAFGGVPDEGPNTSVREIIAKVWAAVPRAACPLHIASSFTR